jgi:hypothetical protein
MTDLPAIEDRIRSWEEEFKNESDIQFLSGHGGRDLRPLAKALRRMSHLELQGFDRSNWIGPDDSMRVRCKNWLQSLGQDSALTLEEVRPLVSRIRHCRDVSELLRTSEQ